MNRSSLRIGLLVLLAILLASSSLVACGGGSKKADEIRIGIMGGQTGPAAAAVGPLLQEIEHIFNYVNEVEGGIDGVPLSWRIVDSKSTPEGGILGYKELRDSFDPAIYISVEDYVLAGIVETIVEDEATVLTMAAIMPQLYTPPGRLFSLGIPTADGFAGFIKWVTEDWKGSGAPKVGVLHWDRQSGLTWKMAQGWAMKQGVELIPAPYTMMTMDLKPQLLTLKDAGVDYIWALAIAPDAAVAVRDFRGLGLAGTIPFVFNEYIEGNVLLQIAGAAAEGFYDYRAESPGLEDSEGTRLFSKIMEHATGKSKWSDNRISMTLKATIEAVVKQAVEDVGWDNLNGQATYNALNKLTSIDTLGTLNDFGFGPNRRVGVSTMKMKKYTTDSTVSIGNWIDLPRIFEGIEK